MSCKRRDESESSSCAFLQSHRRKLSLPWCLWDLTTRKEWKLISLCMWWLLSPEGKPIISNMGDCGGAADLNGVDKSQATRLKGGAIAGILIASALGVAIPLLGRKFRFLRVEGRPFVVAKSFAAGVILATGFVHILGEASERLQSECLPEMPWHKFPWTGFIAMMSVFLTLVVDAVGTEYYERKHGVFMGHGHGALESASSRVAVDNKTIDEEKNTLDFAQREKETEHLRHVVISQVRLSLTLTMKASAHDGISCNCDGIWLYMWRCTEIDLCPAVVSSHQLVASALTSHRSSLTLS